MRKLAVAGFALAVLALGLWVRGAVMTVHAPTPPGVLTEVVVEVDGSDPIALRARGLALACTAAVSSTLVGPVTALGEDRFRFRLRPALDGAEERELRGCLHDTRVDRALGEVVRLARVDAATAAP